MPLPFANRELRNSAWGVVDFALQPLLMLLSAPMLLRALGPVEFGAWMLVNSVTASVASFGGGFGEATIRFVALYRGRGDVKRVSRSASASLVISAGLGLVLSAALALAAPMLARSVFRVPAPMSGELVIALRIGAGILLVRLLDAVFTATLRGCERYGPPVGIASVGRIVVVGAAVVLSAKGQRLVPILVATFVVSLITLVAQATAVRLASGIRLGIPGRADLREVWDFGIFTWAKSVAGMLISHGDRLLVARFLGMSSLAYYSICAQVTQPIPALVGSGLHFTYPKMSMEHGGGNSSGALRVYRNAVRFSILTALLLCAPIIFFGRSFLQHWLSPEAARIATLPLMLMTAGNGVLALSAVPQYAALSQGKARLLALINTMIGLVSVVCGAVLLREWALPGAAMARVAAGLFSLTLFAVVRGGFQERDRQPKTEALRAVQSSPTEA